MGFIKSIMKSLIGLFLETPEPPKEPEKPLYISKEEEILNLLKDFKTFPYESTLSTTEATKLVSVGYYDIVSFIENLELVTNLVRKNLSVPAYYYKDREKRYFKFYELFKDQYGTVVKPKLVIPQLLALAGMFMEARYKLANVFVDDPRHNDAILNSTHSLMVDIYYLIKNLDAISKKLASE